MPVMRAVGMFFLSMSTVRMRDVTENRPPSLYMRALQEGTIERQLRSPSTQGSERARTHRFSSDTSYPIVLRRMPTSSPKLCSSSGVALTTSTSLSGMS